MLFNQLEYRNHGSTRKIVPLSLNIDQINSESVIVKSPKWNGEETFRTDGVSIGCDYLRIEGITVSRGELFASSIELQEVVGRGAFSTVRRAYWRKNVQGSTLSKVDPKLHEVAVKDFSILYSSRDQREMFLKELRFLCKVDSPSLVKMYGAFLRDDQVTLVLEFMNGGTLRKLFDQFKDQKSHQPDTISCQDQLFPDSMIASISFQILCGLEYLHSPERRMLHRDLKPVNVLYDGTGSVKLCDFGMASFLGHNSLNTTLLGTSMYMSPERLRAQPYGRPSDIWSFGLILVECITGEPAWKNVNSIVDLIVTIEDLNIHELLPKEVKINPRLREMITGCLEMQSCKRIPSCLLLHSPWFVNDHNLRSVEDAMNLMKTHLLTKCNVTTGTFRC